MRWRGIPGQILAGLTDHGIGMFGRGPALPDLPPFAGEAEIAAELLTRPRRTASKPPNADLQRAGFRPGKCHDNAERAASVMPGARHVLGWLPLESILILHSVVEIDSRLICVTPWPNPPTGFDFIPDDRLSIRPAGTTFRLYFERRPFERRNYLRAGGNAPQLIQRTE